MGHVEALPPRPPPNFYPGALDFSVLVRILYLVYIARLLQVLGLGLLDAPDKRILVSLSFH